MVCPAQQKRGVLKSGYLPYNMNSVCSYHGYETTVKLLKPWTDCKRGGTECNTCWL